MRPRSYSRGMRNRKTYVNANADANANAKQAFCSMHSQPFNEVATFNDCNVDTTVGLLTFILHCC